MSIQDLDQRFSIVNPDGTPSDYLMRVLRDRGSAQTDTDATVTELDTRVDTVETTLATKANKSTKINTGTGLSGGGDLSADRTLILANTAVTAATYGDATHVPQIAVDAQGRITGASSVAITGGGGSTAWTLITSYDFAIDGLKATVDSGSLSSYNEVLIQALGAGRSVSSQHQVQVSVDGGTTYFSASGNYVNIDTNGASTNQTGATTINTSSSAARRWICHLLNTKGIEKSFITSNVSFPNWNFVASTSDITNVRLTSTSAANWNVGVLKIYAR